MRLQQDLTGEEGTGVWSNMEAIRLHIPAPTLNAAHAFRLASSYRGERELFNLSTQGGWPPEALNYQNREHYLYKLQTAVYVACLASFVQGIDIIQAANLENKWDIDYSSVWQIWRAGCIIQADYISDHILKAPFHASYPPGSSINLLHQSQVARDFENGYTSLKDVVESCVTADFVCPTLSATLEYIKYQSNTGMCSTALSMNSSHGSIRLTGHPQTCLHRSTKLSWTTLVRTCTTRRERNDRCQPKACTITNGNPLEFVRPRAPTKLLALWWRSG